MSRHEHAFRMISFSFFRTHILIWSILIWRLFILHLSYELLPLHVRMLTFSIFVVFIFLMFFFHFRVLLDCFCIHLTPFHNLDIFHWSLFFEPRLTRVIFFPDMRTSFCVCSPYSLCCCYWIFIP